MFHDIRLQAFRSYKNESFEFSKGVNIIVGPNASGKTNLLEALLVAATGSSYRARDTELVEHDAAWARIDVLSDTQKRSVKLVVQPNETVQKEFIIDDKSFKRLSIQYSIPVVIFEPNHLLLLHGSPDMRREYLDGILTQLVPGFSGLRNNYRRALSQRNALLKLDKPSQDQLFVWNLRLSEIGGQIALHRQALVAQFQETIGITYRALAHSDNEVKIHYVSPCSGDQYGSKMLQKLESSQTRDIQRGFTSCGPHRDDLEIILRGHVVQETASRGEIRTLLLALKTKELDLLEEARGKRPILLLDDVFSELDGARRKALTEVIEGYQTFITTTDADVVVQHFMNNCNIIPLAS